MLLALELPSDNANFVWVVCSGSAILNIIIIHLLPSLYDIQLSCVRCDVLFNLVDLNIVLG